MTTACPCILSWADYLKDVAQLLQGSDDLVQRGLMAGCLCEVGES